MKYASGQVAKLLDVVKLKEGPALAVVKALAGRGTVRVSWHRARGRPSVKCKDLVLLERAV